MTERGESTERVDSTLSKGLQILETLAASPKPLGITEIAAQLSMNKSNVHRLVKTLCKMNYAAQEPDRTYRASLKLWRLGTALMSHQRIAGLCVSAMHGLVQATGESVHLSVIEGAHVMHIDKIDSDQTVRAYTERGETAPLHCVASGKVLLAYNYEHLRDAAIQSMIRFTPRTITDPEALDAEMAQIRKLGYARNTGEHRADVAGIAAPVFALGGAAVAAIGISGPTQRLTRQRIREIAPAVVEAGRAASDALSASSA
ncbi:IclR family transcriptional regulator [Acuticoccus sediminis]|uniref:IclR family transcriptional regulator n=1 Tax=Acuticoccus sediminis TaxID=2184697 RepID=A0A8B2NUD2_9HYPH|nr:IclR family transcriptional regulator [Acuticoccus sediminis]RAH99256.1 IclR family transcriptional regulator [Acuticoccus sediminis]